MIQPTAKEHNSIIFMVPTGIQLIGHSLTFAQGFYFISIFQI
jgi:hypothetical protein